MLKSNRKAFTMIELIVVIVILGILAALAIPTFNKVIQNSRDKTATNALQAVNRDGQALRAFSPDNSGAVPTVAETSDMAADKPGSVTLKNAAGATVTPGTDAAVTATHGAGGTRVCTITLNVQAGAGAPAVTCA